VVEGLKRVTGLLASLVVGRIMFAEPLTKPKLIGIAILAVGVPLILFG
jgi:multidrug transporter EmrE-like cation transporter